MKAVVRICFFFTNLRGKILKCHFLYYSQFLHFPGLEGFYVTVLLEVTRVDYMTDGEEMALRLW